MKVVKLTENEVRALRSLMAARDEAWRKSQQLEKEAAELAERLEAQKRNLGDIYGIQSDSLMFSDDGYLIGEFDQGAEKFPSPKAESA